MVAPFLIFLQLEMKQITLRNKMSLGEFLNQSQEAITAIKIIVYSLFAYLGIDGDVVQVLFILMVVDTILGAMKAVILGGLFSFKKLLWGMVTKLSVLIIPMVIALVAKGLSFNFKWFVLAILNILIVAEGFSAISNILSIKSKRNIENVDFISMLLKSIRKGLSAIVYKLLDGIESGIDPDKKNRRHREWENDRHDNDRRFNNDNHYQDNDREEEYNNNDNSEDNDRGRGYR